MNWKIESITSENLEQLAELHLRVFPKTIDPQELASHFDWKYFQNPHGNIVGCIATSPTEGCIGVYGAVPLKLILNGKIIVVYFVVASAVDPAFRKLSIFKELHSYFQNQISETKSSGICFGFPNPLAFKIGSSSLGYHQIFKLYTYRFPLKIETKLEYPRPPGLKKSALSITANRFLRKLVFPFFEPHSYKDIPMAEDLELKECTNLPNDYDEFWEQASNHYQKIVLRDREHLTWRLFQHPKNKYSFVEVRKSKKLVGYFVLDMDYEVKVVDLFVIRDRPIVNEVFYAMLRHISQYSKAAVVRFPIHDEYLELALQTNRAQIMDISPMVSAVYNDSYKKEFESFNQSAGWYLSGNEYLMA